MYFFLNLTNYQQSMTSFSIETSRLHHLLLSKATSNLLNNTVEKRPRETFHAMPLPFVIISLTFNNDCQAKITKEEKKASGEKQKSGIGSRNQDGFKRFFLFLLRFFLLIFCYSRRNRKKTKKPQSRS